MDNMTDNTIKLLPAPAWHAREVQRFLNGEYLLLPETVTEALDAAGVSINPLHFLHISMDRAGMVAYTENSKLGHADRQTRVKLGKYLKRWHGDVLDAPEIARIAGLLRGYVDGAGLMMAETAEEIRSVYEDGPSSCMAYSVGSYDTDGTHPVEVYGGPDTAVAYVMRNDRVTARTVINKRENTYVRIYGDKETLKPLLEDAGYTPGSLAGCRCARLENDHGALIFPYVDGSAEMVTDTGNYLVIGYDGEYHGARNTNGLLEDGETCQNCGDGGMDSDYMYYVEDEGLVCECCIERHYVPVEDNWGDVQYVHENCTDDCVALPDGRWLTDHAFDNQEDYVRDIDGDIQDIDDCVWSESEDEWLLADDAIEYIDSAGDTAYMPKSREDELVQDVVTDEMILREDAVETAHGYVREA